MKVWGVSFNGERYGMAFDCPGCTLTHVVNVARYTGAPNHFPVWGWNGSQDAPTFTPSLLVSWPKTSNGERTGIDNICHSFIRDGRVEFLSDCTHALAGQTVELPDVEPGKAW